MEQSIFLFIGGISVSVLLSSDKSLNSVIKEFNYWLFVLRVFEPLRKEC